MRYLLAIVCALAVVASGIILGPQPLRLGQVTGDGDLAKSMRSQVGNSHHVFIGLRTDGRQRWAGFGADETTEFEIGSVTKTLTGGLLMDAVQAGQLTEDTTVEQILGQEARGSAVADVTVAELATHTAGFPRLGGNRFESGLRSFMRKDPYTASPQDVLKEGLAVKPKKRGSVDYSNLGVAFLGQLLAHRLGAPYQELIATRVSGPLNMTDTHTPITAKGLDGPTGFTGGGFAVAAWTMSGSAPAGGVRSTGQDMMTWVTAVQDGTKPFAQGVAERKAENKDEGVGITWMREKLPNGKTLVWHNGRTGGFASYLGFIEGTTDAVVILADVARPVDDLAKDLLLRSTQEA